MVCCDSNCRRQFDDLPELLRHYLRDHEARLVPGQYDSMKVRTCHKHGVRKDIKELIKCGGCASTVSFAFEQFDSSCEECWSYMKSEYVNGNFGHRWSSSFLSIAILTSHDSPHCPWRPHIMLTCPMDDCAVTHRTYQHMLIHMLNNHSEPASLAWVQARLKFAIPCLSPPADVLFDVHFALPSRKIVLQHL